MAKVTYIEFSGTEHNVDIPSGDTVMDGAYNNDLPGIDADCRGACACATCHVYVDATWVSKVPPKESAEENMLEFVYESDPVHSRLACQVTVTDDLDGLIIRMPERQH